jgi:hypothetical protein
MSPNKYVDFVSDEDFLKCVKLVCDSYPEDTANIDMGELQRNTIDPFKVVFDIMNTGMNINSWISNEKIRQNDKTINNKIGEFHQMLLGFVNGWKNLGIGDDTKVDLKKEDNTIFVELKNKWNTMNSDATDKCHDKLANAIRDYPKATAYWAYIISKDGSSGQSVWRYHDDENDRIKKIWGKEVYKMITGRNTALDELWKALPLAISDYLDSKIKFSEDEKQQLGKFFTAAFTDNVNPEQKNLGIFESDF